MCVCMYMIPVTPCNNLPFLTKAKKPDMPLAALHVFWNRKFCNKLGPRQPVIPAVLQGNLWFAAKKDPDIRLAERRQMSKFPALGNRHAGHERRDKPSMELCSGLVVGKLHNKDGFLTQCQVRMPSYPKCHPRVSQ